jgi:Tfp pilus assembly protein PilP
MSRVSKAWANAMTTVVLSLCLGGAVQAQAQPQAKHAKKPAHKASTAKPEASAAQAPAATPAAKEPVVNKRDPFVPLINDKKEGSGPHLPPGKAGLQVATMKLDGTVKSAGGMIAVVSNPDDRVYFIREGDRLYDGQVEKIGLDGVTLREYSKDAFGKPVEREVTKRLYASAGEQQ